MNSNHSDLRPPQPGAKAIGQFEWWFEELSGGGRLLQIQHRARTADDVNPFFYPELNVYGGWGKPVEEVTEAQIIAVFLQRKATVTAMREALGEEALDFIFERFYATLGKMSFAEILGLLMAPLAGNPDAP